MTYPPPHHPQYSPGQVPVVGPQAGPPPPGWQPPPPPVRGGLNRGSKTVLFVGPVLMLLLCCGGVSAISALTGDPQPTEIAAPDQQDRPAAATDGVAPPPGPVTVAPADSPTPSATATPAASVQTKTVTETEKIGFKTKKVNDPNLAKGKTSVRTKGVPGVRTLTYEVTLTDGVETDRRLVGNKVTKQPVTQVIAVGTKPASKCDPNYSGACVPIASDVDCAGGSGNGPAYVRGPVYVIGSDIYGLDRDGDGVACED
ncbi:G5 domain-containing protein [Solwaraspora sp. WMMD1047]|uniref:G5 domain-containing protein n=1 Tax=Solwaraspora sp. WMMD1047 TaxID=3016102 RepID=UPI0024172657|nr:G5 domain-containing protein [Solwaraspora sp. WMMD1047]MDG4833606.1 G5 domain-containing protein [Solwaraspora sp. WMMD1047]